MKRWSIARRLNTRLLAVLAFSWLAGLSLALWVAKEEFAETFDSAMVETAQLLLSLATAQMDSDELGQTLEEAREAQQAMRFGDHEEYLSYQLRLAAGPVLVTSHSAPTAPLPIPLEVGFADLDGKRVYTERSADGLLFLQIIDHLEHRREALWETGLLLALPLLPLLAACGWLIIRSVQDGMASVRQLGTELGLRHGHHLAPVSVDGLPVELVTLAEAANRLFARLDHALRSERHFASNSAHELRTPIASALAQVQRLIALSPDADFRRRGEAIEASLSQLSRLVERLLQLARAEAGIAMDRSPVNILPAVELIIDEARRRVDSGPEITVTGLDRGVLVVATDLDAFAIAWRNLVDNALLHGTADAPIDIQIAPDGITIANDCEPLSPEQLAKLGQHFERLSTSTEGFGLGLAITRAIIEQSGGRLELASPIPGRSRGFAARLAFT